MNRWTPFIATVAGLALPLAALAQEPAALAGDEAAEFAVTTSESVAFQPLEVPGFDPGVQLAVIHGDPNAAAGDYTLRLSFPAGYRFPAHYHPKAEHLTVLEGTMLLAMGETVDPAAMQSYAPGAFIYIPAEHPHYGGVEGPTVIQLHGMAPFEIKLVEAGT